MSLDELERRLPSRLEGEVGRHDFVEQAASLVHGPHDVVHPRQHVGRLVDHEVGALGHDVELVVGDQRGDLDDGVALRVQPGHLQVEPDEHGV